MEHPVETDDLPTSPREDRSDSDSTHDDRRGHRRRRMRRHGRRAYIRSVYFLPSLATLGNAICGFGAMYVATLSGESTDRITNWFLAHQFVAASYLVFLAMLFDALDGRLARFARHTTDFGGQLDSLADVVSFGAAPAFLALQVFKVDAPEAMPAAFTRLVWAFGALYLACAAIRLARFNVSNEHGEQHHFSFLGLPSPGAAGAIVALVLMQQDLKLEYAQHGWILLQALSYVCVWLLPPMLLICGLLMVSAIRYPHVINRYLRGRRSIGRLMAGLILLLLLVVAHRYVLGIGMLAYVLYGLVQATSARFRVKPAIPT